jgi:hypothetical protein
MLADGLGRLCDIPRIDHSCHGNGIPSPSSAS